MQIVAYGVGVLIFASVDDTSSDGIADKYLFMTMTPDERLVELRAMVDGEKDINCAFLEDADAHAVGMLDFAALGAVSGDEAALWRDVRNLYRASGC